MAIPEELSNEAALTALIVGEAANQELLGKIAIACVARNRVEDSRWPDTYLDVIFQPMQFSCFNGLQGLDKQIPPSIWQRYFLHHWKELWWRECRFAAHGALRSYYADVTGGANHYFATYIETPYWAKDQTPTCRIGDHVFYRL